MELTWKIQLGCWIPYQNKGNTEVQAVYRSSKLSEIFATIRLSV